MIAALALYLAAFALVAACGPTRHDRVPGIVFWPPITLVAFVALWALSTGIRPEKRRIL